jgi:hypothetical protein
MVDPTTVSMIRDIVAIFGVIAGFSYYVLTVRNNNMARQLQLISYFSRRLSDRELSKTSLELLDMQWEDFDDFLRKYDSTVNHDNYSMRASMFGMTSELGFTLNKKLIDIETVCDMLQGGYAIIQMWQKFEPIFMKQREIYGDPKRYQWFEYLVEELVKERVRQGMEAELVNYDGYWND